MIDSIKIKIEFGKGLKIKQRDLFTPELKKRTLDELTDTERKTVYKRSSLIRFKLIKQKSWGYMPKLWIDERIDKDTNELIYDTTIEVSLPKLVYGNNLQELSESDLNLVCTKMIDRFSQIGIFIKRDILLNAQIMKLDIGKNFILPDDMHPHEIINIIAKTGSSKAYEGARERYSNDGSLARIRSGSREDIFYDKIKDTQKTQSKAHDKKGKDIEKAFVESCNLYHLNMLRYEYRFIRIEPLKSDVNTYLKRDYNEKISLSQIFNDDLCKHLLRKAWCKIYTKPANQTLFKVLDVPTDEIVNTIMKAKGNSNTVVHSFNTAFNSASLVLLIKEFGVDMTRQLCLDGWCSKTCGTRLDERLKTANGFLKDLPVSNAMSFIDTEMQTFKRLTLATFEKYRII